MYYKYEGQFFDHRSTILGGKGIKSLRSIFEKMDVKGALDLTYFEPSEFCDMSKAFYMCSAKNIILGNLNTHKATKYEGQFFDHRSTLTVFLEK